MKKIFLATMLITGVCNAQLLEFKIPGYDGLPINGGGCWEVIPFDIDSDSDLDIIVLRAHEYDEVYLNDGEGHFTLRTDLSDWQIPGGSHSYATADFNNDGHNDLVIGRSVSSGSSEELPGHDMLLIHDISTNVLVEANANLPDAEVILWFDGERPSNKYNYTMGTAVGNFNGDEIPEIAMVNGGIIYQIRIEPLKPFNWILADYRDKILENNLYFGQPDNTVEGMPIDGVYDYVDHSDLSDFGSVSDISTDLAVGDFNGDGLDDIFVTNFYHSPLTLLLPASATMSKLYLNNPDDPGNFQVSDDFPELIAPATSVAAADFDEDGDLDLFVGMEGRALNPLLTPFDSQPILYINDGDGNFTTADSGVIPFITNQCQRSVYDVNFADVNGDGHLDIFMAGMQNTLLLLDPSDMTYVDATDDLPLQESGFPFTFHAYGSTLNDFDGDTDIDIIMVDTYEQNRIHQQNEEGKFIDLTTFNLPPNGENNTDIAIGDLDNDGDKDIISSIYEDCDHLQSVHVQDGSHNGFPLFNDRSAIFNSTTDKSLDRGVEIFDVDGDDLPEVLFTGYSYDVPNRFFLNGGDLNFTESATSLFPGLNDYENTNKAVIETINDDGLVIAFLPNGKIESTTGGIEVPEVNALFQWNGSQFILTDWIPADIKVTATVDFADLNADGWKDILVVNENDKMDIYLSSSPTETSPNYISIVPDAFVNNRSIDAKFVDIEGDGDWDIVEATSCCSIEESIRKATVYINQGEDVPTFERKSFGYYTYQASSIDVMDLNEDGFMDVVIMDRDSLYFYHWNESLENYENVTEIYTSLNSVSGLALSGHGIKVLDINEDGLEDIYLARDNQDLLLYGQDETSGLIENTDSNSGTDLRAYPNPTTGNTTLSFNMNTNAPFSISVYSLTGTKIFEKQFSGAKGQYHEEIDLTDLQNGLYIVKLDYKESAELIKLIRLK